MEIIPSTSHMMWETHPIGLSERHLNTLGYVGVILETTGVGGDRVQAFQEKCGEEFGSSAAFNPINLIDPSRFELVTPQVKISVDPKFSYMVETRIINGKKYVLIPADEGVEVNGVAVKITE